MKSYFFIVNSSVRKLLLEMAAAADPRHAATMARYFKTGAGGYGEGDRFIGLKVPVMRKIALGHPDLSEAHLRKLLASKIHEHRFVALLILVARFERAGEAERRTIYRFYLSNTAGINNWDLVDVSARDIVGAYLLKRPRAMLRKLAKAPNVWERRIAIVATHAFIYAGHTAETFALSKLLLKDKHDLIHKAVGWMLREAGKISRPELVAFLETNYAELPRTTLRYAIEHFPPPDRERMLARNRQAKTSL